MRAPADVGDVDLSCGALKERFEVIGEPVASVQPGESALNDPAAGRNSRDLMTTCSRALQPRSPMGHMCMGRLLFSE